MKKSSAALVVIVMASLILSGCDAFRRIAGRPTSSQIQEKRNRIEAWEAARQHRLDSLFDLEQRIADSLAALDSIRIADSLETAATAAEVGNGRAGTVKKTLEPGTVASAPIARFCIVIGTFGSRQNAQKLASVTESKGYPATLIKGRNGMTIVTVCPSETEDEALECLAKISGKSFCPKDAWVLERK